MIGKIWLLPKCLLVEAFSSFPIFWRYSLCQMQIIQIIFIYSIRLSLLVFWKKPFWYYKDETISAGRKGMGTLTTLFSNIKFNKICYLNYLIKLCYLNHYLNHYLCRFFHTYILLHFVFYIITHMDGSILNKKFSKWLPERFVNIIIWLHFLFGFKSNMVEWLILFLDKLQIFCEQYYFRLFK